MTGTTTTSKSKDRWTVFWLILPLILVVIAGFTTWYIAADIAPQKLPVDTLNNPRLVQVYFAADQNAASRELDAELQWSNQQFTVVTNQPVSTAPLRLHLSHISDASHDVYVILDRVNDQRFVARTTTNSDQDQDREAVWYMELEAGEPENPEWRLLGKWHGSGPVLLKPRDLESNG